jgi:outer membrane scaffolding protein for murein synthesis (MipA/OmpV family)
MRYASALLAALAAMLSVPSAAGTIKPEDWFAGALAIRDDRDQEWKVNLGAGAFYAPKGTGSDDYKVFPLPLIDADYRDTFFFSTARGFGFNAFKRQNLKAGFRVTIDYGRDASATTRTKTLQDVDPAPEVGAFVESYVGSYRFKMDIRQAFGGHEGMVGGLDVARASRMSDDIVLLLGGKLTLADEAYMDSYYGVPRSNRTLTTHSPSGGFHDIAAYLAIVYQMDRNWYFSYDVRYSQLLGDAAGSPVTEKSGQGYVGVTVGYRF